MTQRNSKPVVLTVIAAWSLATALVACGGGTSSSSDSSATAAPTTQAIATTTATAPTTEAPTTTIAPTTTTTPVVLTLRIGGLGPFDFGAVPEDVIAGVTAQLGAPVRDDVDDYPVSNGAGYYRNAGNEDISYKFQSGRTVCWSNGLCTAFGAEDPAAPVFTGWVYQDDPAPTLSTDLGLTLGSQLADHPEVDMAPFPCYTNYGNDYDAMTYMGEFPHFLVVLHGSDVVQLSAGEFRTDVGSTSCLRGI